MSSGDVGHFDEKGRLFIDGRDDEMIVSGGENVFPGEVEELLAGHEAVEEVAAIGVDDEKFGQRLKAFVVAARRQGAQRGRGQGLRQGQPGPLQGPARGGVHRRAAAQPDRQGAQARAGRWTATGLGAADSGVGPRTSEKAAKAAARRTSNRAARIRAAVRRLPGGDLPAGDGRGAPGTAVSLAELAEAVRRHRRAARRWPTCSAAPGTEDTMRANEAAFRALADRAPDAARRLVSATSR